MRVRAHPHTRTHHIYIKFLPELQSCGCLLYFLKSSFPILKMPVMLLHLFLLICYLGLATAQGFLKFKNLPESCCFVHLINRLHVSKNWHSFVNMSCYLRISVDNFFQDFATGSNCDQCKPGYFNLAQENPNGCLSCVCSGVGRQCRSSRHYRSQVHLILEIHHRIFLEIQCHISNSF